MRIVLHIDFNSYFATVEQQANPRLRGKPIGVTGGDRMTRTVVGAASVEAKEYGVKTGMSIPDALRLCPNLILVNGDSSKYLECTKRFLNVLKKYSPFLEVFSIDEVFLELPSNTDFKTALSNAEDIKKGIYQKIGTWIKCSIGISYNKKMAKLAGSLFKPNGLVAILDEEAAMRILDQVELDEICGIGSRIKKRLNNLGVFNFSDLRKVPLDNLLASFKSYGQILYHMARGIDNSLIVPFYEKEEVKSVGHRHTINHDTEDLVEIKQILLKLCELVARRMRAKKLVGKTISFWYRAAFSLEYFQMTGSKFYGEGKQSTIMYTDDGLEIFNGAWAIFLSIWQQEKIRMVGVSVSNIRSKIPQTESFLDEDRQKERIDKVIDKINDAYGEFTLKRGILIYSPNIYRKPNPFLADYRFKI